MKEEYQKEKSQWTQAKKQYEEKEKKITKMKDEVQKDLESQKRNVRKL